MTSGIYAFGKKQNCRDAGYIKNRYVLGRGTR